MKKDYLFIAFPRKALELDNSSIRLLLTLIDASNRSRKDTLKYSIRMLTKDTGLSVHIVLNCLNVLKEKDYISISKRKNSANIITIKYSNFKDLSVAENATPNDFQVLHKVQQGVAENATASVAENATLHKNNYKTLKRNNIKEKTQNKEIKESRFFDDLELDRVFRGWLMSHPTYDQEEERLKVEGWLMMGENARACVKHIQSSAGKLVKSRDNGSREDRLKSAIEQRDRIDIMLSQPTDISVEERALKMRLGILD